ncbi:MAG: outer membrane beta-barrel protein [Magnetococcales bacterium]|nr:outer membrane beta-barrel protein [Magnetococcales bacterium]
MVIGMKWHFQTKSLNRKKALCLSALLALTPALAVIPTRSSAAESHQAMARTPSENYYTLQVFGSYDPNAVLNYITARQLKGRSDFYQFELDQNGKRFYAVSFGIFPSKQDAEKARQRLKSLWHPNYQPWARTLGSVYGKTATAQPAPTVQAPPPQIGNGQPNHQGRYVQQAVPVPRRAAAPQPRVIMARPAQAIQVPMPQPAPVIVQRAQPHHVAQRAAPVQRSPRVQPAQKMHKGLPVISRPQNGRRVLQMRLQHPNERGWYIGTAVGASLFNAKGEDMDNAMAKLGYNSDIDYDNTSYAFKLYGGLRLNRYAALETGYSNYGQIKSSGNEYTEADGFLKAALKEHPMSAQGLYAGVQGSVPYGDFSLHGRLGALAYYGDAYITNNDTGEDHSRSEFGMTPYYGLGAMLNIGEDYAARMDWERVDIENTEIDTVTMGVQASFQ